LHATQVPWLRGLAWTGQGGRSNRGVAPGRVEGPDHRRNGRGLASRRGYVLVRFAAASLSAFHALNSRHALSCSASVTRVRVSGCRHLAIALCVVKFMPPAVASPAL